MNRNQAKELLPIIKAYAEGREIEIFDETKKMWVTAILPHFDCNSSFYRIKPESKYRPFANAEECWNEMQKHQPFGWIKDKKDGQLVLITEIDRTGNISLLCNGGWDLDGIKDNFTFADGTPFGLEEE